jgi:hypothetical protein
VDVIVSEGVLTLSVVTPGVLHNYGVMLNITSSPHVTKIVRTVRTMFLPQDQSGYVNRKINANTIGTQTK